MSPIQALPSFNAALHPDHRYTTVLPKILYPSRPSAHIPWSGPSAPLVFSRTTRTASPSIQVLTPDTCQAPGAFYGVGTLIWHSLSRIIKKLKVIKQKLFGV